VTLPRLALIVIALGVSCSCGSSSSPSSPTAPSSSSATVSSVLVSGGTSLSKAGQTVQLTATATFSDGTTQNVRYSGCGRNQRLYVSVSRADYGRPSGRGHLSARSADPFERDALSEQHDLSPAVGHPTWVGRQRDGHAEHVDLDIGHGHVLTHAHPGAGRWWNPDRHQNRHERRVQRQVLIGGSPRVQTQRPILSCDNA
jgi:hypothetical protein